MASVATQRRRRRRPHGRPKAQLVDVRGDVLVTLPYAPVDADHGGLGLTYAQRPRSGVAPLLVRVGANLRTVRLELFIGHPDDDVIVDKLNRIEAIADAGRRVRLRGAGADVRGWWVISDAGYGVARRNDDNNPTRAVYGITLTRDNRVTAAALSGVDNTRPRRYTIKPGDRFWTVAEAVYGDGKQWRRILRANDARTGSTLALGQVLGIPTQAN